jgi:hypothetical protein
MTGVWTDRADEVLDVDVAAQFAACSPEEVERALRSGALADPHGALLRRDVAAWIESERLLRGVPLCNSMPPELLPDLLANGVAILPGAVGPVLLARLRAWADSLLAQPQPSPPAQRIEQNTPRGRVLERIRNLGSDEPIVAELACHPLITALGTALLGDYVVYQVSVVVKLPRVGVAIPAHRDPTWTTRRLAHPVIAVGFYLDDADANNGGPWFCPGTHRAQRGRAPDCSSAAPRVHLRVTAGSAVVHNLGVVHGSDVNSTALLRRTVYCSLMSAAEAHVSQRDAVAHSGLA